MIDWSLKKKNTSKNKNIFSLIHWKYSTKRTNYFINRWKKKLTPKRYTSPIIYKNPGSETRSTKSSATDPRNLDQKITPHSKRTLKTFPPFIPSRFANRVNRSTLDDFFKRIIRRRWIIDRGGRRRKKEKKKVSSRTNVSPNVTRRDKACHVCFYVPQRAISMHVLALDES